MSSWSLLQILINMVSPIVNCNDLIELVYPRYDTPKVKVNDDRVEKYNFIVNDSALDWPYKLKKLNEIDTPVEDYDLAI